MSRQSSIFYLPYFLYTAPQNILCCEYLMILYKIKLSVFNVQGPLHSNKLMPKILKEALQNHMTLCWSLFSTHKNHIISTQYPSHKCLPKKSRLDCLWTLIMSWLFKDPAVIMNKIISCHPIVIVIWLNFNHSQSNSKKQPKKIKLPQVKFFSKNS